MNSSVINHYIERHEAFLKQIINSALVPATTIRSAINYSLFPGGKRFRPILVYLTGNLINLNIEVLDVIAVAIELTHCYSLIHDDLPAMDNDDLRRGKPSCHKAFDEATAILAGDGMQALAIEVLLTELKNLLQPTLIINLVLELVKASGISGMVSGQSMDLSELAKASISEAQLREIHYLKTGRLISACVSMVLAAHPSTEAEQHALKTYANHLGLVFQMQDDYLDLYAPKDLLGKGRASDLANQKTTFATLYSKTQLEEEIDTQYQKALDALSLFADQANDLIELTLKLQSRSLLN